jgi:flavin-dependent dehydrogenase
LSLSTLPPHFDVVVLGGGLAGLTLARQLGLARPATRVLVVEAAEHPPPEAAHKVGESCVEVAGTWLRDTLQLRDHLDACHLPKLGLRFFLPAGEDGGKTDIASRVELGPVRNKVPVPFKGLLVPSYQLDRGRLEAHLADDLGHPDRSPNVRFVDRCKATQVDLQADGHRVHLTRDGRSRVVTARWVIDATGRRNLLKKRLGLNVPSPHKANAVWFRVRGRIQVDQWAEDTEWSRRIAAPIRWHSTCHLMDRGYWVWLIPLAGGITSVGIVTDAAEHEFASMNRFDRAMQWLQAHEPQAAERIAAALAADAADPATDGDGTPLDFLALRRYATDTTRVFSGERWGLTGDSGLFCDPFYSPGSDFIAVVNTHHVDLITRDLDGQDIVARADRADHYVHILYAQFMRAYEGAYPLMGNAQVMSAKIAFDTAFYWGWVALLFLNGGLTDPDFMDSIQPEVERMIAIQGAAQRLFREWGEAENLPCDPTIIDQFDIAILWRIYTVLIRPIEGDVLRRRVSESLDRLEAFVDLLFRRAARSHPEVAAADSIRVPAITLDDSLWSRNRLFEGPDRGRELRRIKAGLEALWVDGAPGPTLPSRSAR